jgi:hypothetical protein
MSKISISLLGFEEEKTNQFLKIRQLIVYLENNFGGVGSLRISRC